MVKHTRHPLGLVPLESRGEGKFGKMPQGCEGKPMRRWRLLSGADLSASCPMHSRALLPLPLRCRKPRAPLLEMPVSSQAALAAQQLALSLEARSCAGRAGRSPGAQGERGDPAPPSRRLKAAAAATGGTRRGAQLQAAEAGPPQVSRKSGPLRRPPRLGAVPPSPPPPSRWLHQALRKGRAQACPLLPGASAPGPGPLRPVGTHWPGRGGQPRSGAHPRGTAEPRSSLSPQSRARPRAFFFFVLFGGVLVSFCFFKFLALHLAAGGRFSKQAIPRAARPAESEERARFSRPVGSFPRAANSITSGLW